MNLSLEEVGEEKRRNLGLTCLVWKSWLVITESNKAYWNGPWGTSPVWGVINSVTTCLQLLCLFPERCPDTDLGFHNWCQKQQEEESKISSTNLRIPIINLEFQSYLSRNISLLNRFTEPAELLSCPHWGLDLLLIQIFMFQSSGSRQAGYFRLQGQAEFVWGTGGSQLAISLVYCRASLCSSPSQRGIKKKEKKAYS